MVPSFLVGMRPQGSASRLVYPIWKSGLYLSIVGKVGLDGLMKTEGRPVSRKMGLIDIP